MKNILITGTTSGLGKALVDIYAQEKDNHLILVSRSAEKLVKQKEELDKANVSSEIIVQDLIEKDAATKLYEVVKDYDLDLVIHNAGFGKTVDFQDMNSSTLVDMICVNDLFVVEFTRLVLPRMIKNKKGQFLFVASIAAYFGAPYNAVYSATKAFIYNFAISLKTELKKYNIKISVLCPGPMQTEFASKSHMEDSLAFKTTDNPAKIARITKRKLENNKAVIIPTYSMKFVHMLSLLTPTSFQQMLAKAFLKIK